MRGRTAFYPCIRLRGRDVVVRVEDSCRAANAPPCADAAAAPLFAGNKRWKLQHWIQRDDFPAGSFLVSHGGYQSNAMLALAQLARMKRIGFVYYTKSLPSSPPPGDEGAEEGGAPEARGERRVHRIGRSNLEHALTLGMQIKSLSAADYALLFGDGDGATDGASRVPPEVAAEGTLETERRARRAAIESEEGAIFEGIRDVALDINAYARERATTRPSGDRAKPLLVVLPSGTGTTAFYLARHLSEDVSIACVPCVGRSSYLRAQMERLGAHGHDRMPTILDPPPGRYSFARPSASLLQTWRELQQAAVRTEIDQHEGFEFDLVYAPRTWQTVFHHWDASLAAYDLLYLHTGGLEGNPSQLQRYHRSRLVPGDVS